MRLIAINGHEAARAPWRGALVLRGDDDGPGVLIDPTGALAARLDADPGLCHRAGLDAAVRAVVLTAARLEQVAALIGLRHGAPIELYTTPGIFEDLSSTLPVLPELQRHCEVHWRMVPVAGDQACAAFRVDGHDELQFTAVANRDGSVRLEPGRSPVLRAGALSLALDDTGSGRRIVWLRGPQRLAADCGTLIDGADLVAVVPDGDAPDPQLIDWLASLPVPRKLLLGGPADPDGQLARLGIEQPRDGLEIVL